jgi:hypothetical protein
MCQVLAEGGLHKMNLPNGSVLIIRDEVTISLKKNKLAEVCD